MIEIKDGIIKEVLHNTLRCLGDTWVVKVLLESGQVTDIYCCSLEDANGLNKGRAISMFQPTSIKI